MPVLSAPLPPVSSSPIDFLARCEEAHASVQLPFAYYLDHFFSHGYVFKGPDYFVMFQIDPDRPDAWFVWWADVAPGTFCIRKRAAIHFFLGLMPHYLPYVSWARSLKGRTGVRYFSTERLRSLT